jgi:hypothetical protein
LRASAIVLRDSELLAQFLSVLDPLLTVHLCAQGFDEFMNLVIDDAVEVKQITKTNSEEKRRSLGTDSPLPSTSFSPEFHHRRALAIFSKRRVFSSGMPGHSTFC